MDIVIISEFCEDFSDTDNDRFLYIAKLLANNKENEVEIVTSNFQHTTKKHRNKPVIDWPLKITFIEEPGYSKNVCIKRVFSHHKWGKNIDIYIRNRKKPDVVYCAVPSLTGPKLVAEYCEQEKIRFIIDVQDLWPEAFQMVVNIPVISDVVFKPFVRMADNIYKRADVICAVSDTYSKRAAYAKNTEEYNTVFLGTELDVFDSFARYKPIIKKRSDNIWIGYCGTLGSSYDITCVIDALSILQDNRIEFIVMGDGPRMEEFKHYSRGKGINIKFVGRLRYDKMCSLLSSCDLVVNPIRHLAAQSIINKHADYAAAGKPILNTQENEEYRNLVEQYNMGLNCNNDNPEDLAKKIEWLIENKEDRLRMGDNARRCAEEKFDRKVTYIRLKEVIEDT